MEVILKIYRIIGTMINNHEAANEPQTNNGM